MTGNHHPTDAPDEGTNRLLPAEVELSTSWKLPHGRLSLGRVPRLMGIVNVTPDSFSDGGEFFSTTQAVDHALRLVEQGADILDIGGESTRPYSEPVTEQEELARVVPVIRQLTERVDIPISVDTSKAAVAAAAIDAGASILNDVTGLEGDPDMLPLAVERNVAVCAMHMQGTPQTMQDAPSYGDVVGDIMTYLRERLDRLVEAGIDREAICLDPGIGFGKTQPHNMELMRRVGEFHALGQPILVGHSRKGFLAKILEDKEVERATATIGATLALMLRHIQIVRIHDVAAHRRALLAFAACHLPPPASR